MEWGIWVWGVEKEWEVGKMREIERVVVELEFFGEIEGWFMERVDGWVVGRCGLGENGDGIWLFEVLGDWVEVKVVRVW